jgi:hypothetical protein
LASTNFVVKNGLTVASGTVVAGGSGGSNGQVLSSTGTGVQWVNASSASGDVVGPASSTDNAVVRFDSTTGKLIQNSTATLSDGGIMVVTELNTDSIKSATVNSPIVIAPDGTGDVHLNADSVRIGDNNANATIATHGTGDLILTTHEGSAVEGIVRLYDGANGNITLTPNGSGQVQVGTDQVVTLAASQTLTNKTISGSSNTLSNIANASLTNSTISGVALGSNLNTLTISSPLTGTSYNGSSAVSIGIPVATTSANGYLSSTDWTTFNNKGSGSVISVTGGTYLTGGTITTTGTLAVDATSANTASKVVARDASGNFSAGTITASLSGNATNVTGTVAVANGGTGSATLTSGSYVVGAGTSAVTLKTPTQVTADLDTFTYQIGGTAGKKGLVPAAPAVGGPETTVYLNNSGGWSTPSAGGTTTNALTISSPLSGTSFNGSSATTIALSSGYGDLQNPYASKTANYVLAAPNGSAGVPTFRAIVAADIPTLNQNTTGYAGYLNTTNQGLTGSTGLTTVSSTTAWSNYPIGYSAMFNTGQTATGAPSSNYGFFIKIANRDAGGGWGGIWTDYSGGDTYVGNTTVSSSYATWYKLLSSTNYNSYAPTLTGTGASGTWGIAISGNSATATSAATLTTARTINTTSFNGSADITIGSKSNIGTPSSAGTNYYGTIYVTQNASPTGGSTGDLYLVY